MQRPYLDIAGSPIEVEVAALDIAVVRKLVNHLLFGGFLVHVGHNYDPAFHSCRGIQAESVAGASRTAILHGLLTLCCASAAVVSLSLCEGLELARLDTV